MRRVTPRLRPSHGLIAPALFASLVALASTATAQEAHPTPSAQALPDGALAQADAAKAKAKKATKKPALPVQSRPDPPPPSTRSSRHQFAYTNLSAFRLNPIGLSTRSWLGYRLKLFPESDSILFKDSYLGIGAEPEITPAAVRGGPSITFQPLAILYLSVVYEWFQYFGTFNNLQFFESASADYDDDTLAANGDNDLNRAATQEQLTLRARLQAKVGPIAARSQFNAYYTRSNDLQANERVYYDQTLDVLAPNQGWVISTDSDLLYLTNFGLTVGLRHHWTRPLYEAKHVLPTEDPNALDLDQHRLGPLVAYVLDEDPSAAVQKQTLFTLLHAWLKHPNRTENRVVPYFVLGYAIQGNFGL